jgi:heterotetrameric sarcosine oxidase gamma subunit
VDEVILGEPEARSPLRGHAASDAAVASAGAVVEDLCHLAKVLVRCDDPSTAHAVLGAGFGRARWRDGVLTCGSGVGEWLVVGPPGQAAGLVGRLRDELASAQALTTVLDLTHGRALVRLRGPGVRTLLSRVTAFDLDDRLVPDGAAWRTWVAAVVTDVVRDDRDGRPSYLLHCERSSGRYLVDTLLAAGADHGAVLTDPAGSAGLRTSGGSVAGTT